MARSTASESGLRRAARRGVWAVVGVLVLLFLAEGGEYGTSDLFAQRSKFEALQTEVAELKSDVDSLQAELTSIRTDRVRLERIARERYGMVRGDKEILYWINSASDAESDTTERE